jgi:urease accessory protein
VGSAHYGPLYVQKAFYPEGRDTAHVYLLHPPGGMVSGDRLTLNVDLDARCRVLMTTPGAGRVYRARHDRSLQHQTVRFELSQDAIMEWFPQETIVYPGANARLDTHVSLSEGSRYLGWEICCLGLPASGLQFDAGELRQRLFIEQDGVPVFVESFNVSDLNRSICGAAAGLRNRPVSGVLVAGPIVNHAGEDDQQLALLTALRETLQNMGTDAEFGVTLFNGFVVTRYLGHCSEQAKESFVRLWKLLRPLLSEREACLPRIWAT